jgi:hypothetical protein
VSQPPFTHMPQGRPAEGKVTITGSLIAKGDAVTLHGVVWGSPFSETAIIQLSSGSLVAVPVADIEKDDTPARR